MSKRRGLTADEVLSDIRARYIRQDGTGGFFRGAVATRELIPFLRDEMHSGAWFATGLRLPDIREEEVPAELWPALDFDPDAGTAALGDVAYAGLQFFPGRKRGRPNDKLATEAFYKNCAKEIARRPHGESIANLCREIAKRPGVTQSGETIERETRKYRKRGK